MGEQRTDNDDLSAETKRKGWRNYQERVRADGGVSRFINPTIDGKQRWIQIPDQPKYKGKKGYERFLAETLAEAVEKTTNIRFNEAADEWLAGYAKGKPGTFDCFNRILRLHLAPYFGKTPLNNINSKDLLEFVRVKMGAGLSKKYVTTMSWIFSAIYEPYVNAGLVKRHPGKIKIRYRENEVADNELDELEEDRRESRALTVSEVHLLLDHINPVYRLLTELMIWTGLRVGEALAMQWRYLDTPKKIYNVERNLNRHRQLGTPKTASSRAQVTLSDHICSGLEQHRAEQSAERLRTPTWINQDLIFPSSGPSSRHPGSPRAAKALAEALKKAATRAGIPHVTPHDLRHTCATLLIQKHRANIKEVSIHLRHANPAITQETYGHLYPDDLPALGQAMDRLLLEAK